VIALAATFVVVGPIMLPPLAGQELDAIVGVLVVFGIELMPLVRAGTKNRGNPNRVRFNTPSVDLLYEGIAIDREDLLERVADGA
jgi:hypothetical protein